MSTLSWNRQSNPQGGDVTDSKIMETKPHTYEVTEGLVEKDISWKISIETDKGYGKWYIRITDSADEGEPTCVCLDAADAFAVAEFITSCVRKRW
jgi:hypothetical protein